MADDIKPRIATAPFAEPVKVRGKVVKFIKTMNPVERVKDFVDAGIVFHRPIDRNGRGSHYSGFETADEKLAELVRRVAKERPTLYIREIS